MKFTRSKFLARIILTFVHMLLDRACKFRVLSPQLDLRRIARHHDEVISGLGLDRYAASTMTRFRVDLDRDIF